jgi:cytohesin
MFTARRKVIDCRSALLDVLLFSAVITGNLDEVKQIVIDCGVNPNIKGPNPNPFGFTLLHYAAMDGRHEIAKLLLEHGADPNIQDNNGRTPLHWAAWKGHLEVVELLLEHGADPNVQDYGGMTPLHYAATGHLEVVELLLEHGADPNIKNNNGWTPLHYAAKNCRVGVVRVLLDHGADPTIRDNEGRTPLDIGSDCSEEIREVLRRRSTGTTVYE